MWTWAAKPGLCLYSFLYLSRPCKFPSLLPQVCCWSRERVGSHLWSFDILYLSCLALGASDHSWSSFLSSWTHSVNLEFRIPISSPLVFNKSFVSKTFLPSGWFMFQLFFPTYITSAPYLSAYIPFRFHPLKSSRGTWVKVLLYLLLPLCRQNGADSGPMP